MEQRYTLLLRSQMQESNDKLRKSNKVKFAQINAARTSSRKTGTLTNGSPVPSVSIGK